MRQEPAPVAAQPVLVGAQRVQAVQAVQAVLVREAQAAVAAEAAQVVASSSESVL